MRNPKPTHRDQTVFMLARRGVMLPDILRLISFSRSIQRYAVALCNGEWPYPKPGTYPGAVRDACGSCEATTALTMLKPYRKPGGLLPARAIVRECPLCREAAQVRELWERITREAPLPDCAQLAYRCKLEVCRDGGPGLAVEDDHGYSFRIGG